MREIAKALLAQCPSNPTPWQKNKTAHDLLDYVYNSGIWDVDFLDKIDGLMKKNISELSEKEIYTYLTFIMGRERIDEGLYDVMITNGTIEKLLRRYLEVTE